MLLTNEENLSSENQTASKKKRDRKEAIQYLVVAFIFLIVIAGITALSMLSLDKIIDETTTEQTQPTTKSSRDIWLKELSKKVPYIDMYEEFIGDTSLGKPAETLKYQLILYKGRHVYGNEYKFKKKRKLIFSVECVNDKVVKAVDFRKKKKPYIGMPEEAVAASKLGNPSKKVRHGSDYVDGEKYKTNIYDFKKNGKTIFTATCAFGEVIDVIDYRNLYTPYIGMSEKYISKTELGKPSKKVLHETKKKKGKKYKSNIYNFKKNGKVIFTATCVSGKVKEVFDFRNLKVPYVDMPEKYISKTELGKHEAKIRHGSEYIPSKVKTYKTNIYDFKKDGKLIFSAFCLFGKVIDVYDYRNLKVPRMLMWEEGINSSKLGKPANKIVVEYVDGDKDTFYHFKKNGKVIFVARCSNGRITDVWDYRKNPKSENDVPPKKWKVKIVPSLDRRETTTRPPTTTKKKNSDFDEYDDDHFNVDDYYDAEDFYYDNMDEFYDFYDAEDYFNEYHS